MHLIGTAIEVTTGDCVAVLAVLASICVPAVGAIVALLWRISTNLSSLKTAMKAHIAETDRRLDALEADRLNTRLGARTHPKPIMES